MEALKRYVLVEILETCESDYLKKESAYVIKLKISKWDHSGL
jgi:hypothetical protein